MPHYRASLDTTKNINTTVSQHELLYSLNKNPNALVYYACPMIFEKVQLYEVNVDLSLLRLADISSCPSDYKDNDNHFVFFNETTSQPIWCSDPVEGKAISLRDFASRLADQAKQSSPRQAAATLLETLTNLEAIGLDGKSQLIGGRENPSILPFVSDSLTILKLPHIQNDSR
jgi:hypothetical protein